MDTQNKCCGNCKNFVDKEVGGYGLCDAPNMMCGTHRSNKACSLFDVKSNNGWTEITPDNVDMIDDGSIVIVTDGTYYNKASEWHLSIGTMAKHGGYYYYVLPELKIE